MITSSSPNEDESPTNMCCFVRCFRSNKIKVSTPESAHHEYVPVDKPKSGLGLINNKNKIEINNDLTKSDKRKFR